MTKLPKFDETSEMRRNGRRKKMEMSCFFLNSFEIEKKKFAFFRDAHKKKIVFFFFGSEPTQFTKNATSLNQVFLIHSLDSINLKYSEIIYPYNKFFFSSHFTTHPIKDISPNLWHFPFQ